MSYRAIRSKVSLPWHLFRYPKRTSLWCSSSLPPRNIPFPTSMELPRGLHTNIKPTLGISTRSQTRHFCTTLEELAASRKPRYRYENALRIALNKLPVLDADSINRAIEEVAREYPPDPLWQEEANKKVVCNMHDEIDDGLSEPKLKPDTPWGLAIYRVAYGDQAAWERILAELNRTLVDWGSMYRRARHQFVVMDDPLQFDGMTVDQARDHFRRWSLDEAKRNWRGQPESDDEVAEVFERAGARYNFCLFVDDLCLESVDRMSEPVLKLINKHWEPYDAEEYNDSLDDAYNPAEDPGWEGGVSNDEFEDVGWKYVGSRDYVELQNTFSDRWEWADLYERPPYMRSLDSNSSTYDFEDMPGYWRRNGKSSD